MAQETPGVSSEFKADWQPPQRRWWHSRWFFSGIAIVIIAAVIAIGAYYLFIHAKSAPAPAGEGPDIQGTMILGLGMAGTNLTAADISGNGEGDATAVVASTSPRILLFLDNLEKQTIRRAPLDLLAGSKTGQDLAYQYSFSSDNAYAAFTGALDAPLDDPMPTEIYRADMRSVKGGDAFVSALQNATPLTEGSDTVRQLPSVAPTGDVLYMSHALSADVAAPEDWAIHLITSSGDAAVANGEYPKWLGTDRFVYLKNDGIYLYTLADKSEKLVIPLDSASSVPSVDVADNGAHLAIVLPNEQKIAIYNTTEDADGRFTKTDEVPDVAASGVTFAPSGPYIAVATVSPLDDSADTAAPTLVIYDLSKQQWIAPALTLANIAGLDLYDWRP
jgi:hypothetical protein